MTRSDVISKMRLAARRARDDGTRDIAAGLLLFALAAGLDLGRFPLPGAFLAPVIVVGLQLRFVWPRAGYARATRADTWTALAVFAVAFLVALALVQLVGFERATGFAREGGGADRVRLAALATGTASAALLAWVGRRDGLPRFLAYAAALALAYGVGGWVGLETRAWALALTALAIAALGAWRLRRFLGRLPAPDDEDPRAA